MRGAVGKRVRGALYVHRDAVDLLAPEERAKVAQATRLSPEPAWNVARIEAKHVALLRYRDFEEAAFPRLESSTRVDLEKGTVRRTEYRASANPLILHRKELLVRPDHPLRSHWTEVTRRAERRGLFRNPAIIGRLTRWTQLLRSSGLDEQGEERQ